MSTTDYSGEISERYWEMYLSELRTLSEDNKGAKLTPSLKDFHVWLQDQDIDLDEVDYA